MILSPYHRIPPDRWPAVTKRLIARHPLEPAELSEVVLSAWEAIFKSRIGGFAIGRHIKPKPQIMGFLLHELIPLAFSALYPGVWRPEAAAAEKDLVHIPDDIFSIEIKTSSNPSKIFGNRSYAQPDVTSKKVKAGYYLAINFGKFGSKERPKITLIRFGWLDASDWRGQQAASGQQASLPPLVERGKLLPIYSELKNSAP